MEGWRKVRLGDVAELSGGYAFKSSQYTERGRFVLRTVNIRDDFSITREGATYISEKEALEFSRFNLQDKDTLFVMVAATLGKVGYVRTDALPALLNQNMWAIRAKPNHIDPAFLQFCFRELSKIPLAWVSGSARSFLRRDDVRDLEFDLPPLAEQRAIASLLGALDDKIELNRSMNETLEAMARAIFKDWFVDFGPTRAKMEGRAPYLAPEIWSLFPDRLDEEGKPEGWKNGTLSEYAVLNPESWTRAKFPSEIDYVDLSGTKWGTIEVTERHSKDTAPSRAQRILGFGDTIVGLVRPGNGSYALVNTTGLTGSTGFAVLRPKMVEAVEFTYLAAVSTENIERLTHLADGAAYPAVKPEVVMSTPVIISEPSVLVAFHNVAKPLIARVGANKEEAKMLAAIRDLLLPKLMSGEIRIEDAENLAEVIA